MSTSQRTWAPGGEKESLGPECLHPGLNFHSPWAELRHPGLGFRLELNGFYSYWKAKVETEWLYPENQLFTGIETETLPHQCSPPCGAEAGSQTEIYKQLSSEQGHNNSTVK